MLVWFAAVREQNPPVEGRRGPIAVEVIGVPEYLTLVNDVSGRQINLLLQAPQSSWDNISNEKFRAWIDLSNLEDGLHDVPVRVDVADPSIRVLDIEPKTITLQLAAVAEVLLPVEVQLMDEPPLGYQIDRAPSTEPISVTVRGPATFVAQVKQVTTRILLANSKETIERRADVLPLDGNGEVVTGLTILPDNVEVTVTLRQRFGYRDISVRAITTGTVASGYWISAISSNPNTVTVVGQPSAIRSLSGFVETVPIDISNATAMVSKRVPLNLPPGVSLVEQEDADGTGVLVTIEVAALEGGQTVQREIRVQGVEPGRSWMVSPDRVDVILSGPVPRLQALQLEDVTVVLDLFGLGLDTVHRLEPTVVVPEGLEVKSVLPERVEVVLSRGPTATPTPTPRPSATPSPVPSPTSGVASTPLVDFALTVIARPVVSATVTITPTPAITQTAIAPTSTLTATNP
jgi:YbbR domain-containing protein